MSYQFTWFKKKFNLRHGLPHSNELPIPMVKRKIHRVTNSHDLKQNNELSIPTLKEKI